MSIFGWLTMKEAERYTRSAERRRLAGDATNDGAVAAIRGSVTRLVET
jgi:hypothetical protein